MTLEKFLESAQTIPNWEGIPMSLDQYGALIILDRSENTIETLPKYMPTFSNGVQAVVECLVFMSLLAGMMDNEVLAVRSDIDPKFTQANIHTLTLVMDVDGKEIKDELLADASAEA